MKRFLVFTLLFVYTTLACGVNFQLHYCGGKLKNISLIDASDEDGCCGSKMKSKDCCKNKTTFIKVKDNHNSNSLLKVTTFKGQMLEAIIPTLLCKFQYSIQEGYNENYHAPPVLYDNPLYLKHRVLII